MAKKKSTAAVSELPVAPTPPADLPPRKRFQVFERATCKRSLLIFPEVNPRTIDRHAFRKLKEYLRKKGLKTAIAINRRRAANGFPPTEEGRLVIIGGNQRTRAMDELAGYPARENSDYEVPIDIEEVSPAQEREDIIALNNPGMQGSFDYDLLAEMLVYPGVNPLDTGFDRQDLAMVLDEGVLQSILGGTEVAQQAAVESETIDILGEITEAGREASRAERDAERDAERAQQSTPAGSPNSNLNSNLNSSEPTAEEIAAEELSPEAVREAELQGMRDRRVAYQESIREQNEAAFMVVLVADSDQEMRDFLNKSQLDSSQSTFPLRAFMDAVGASHLLD